jgi:hypothetical protein
MFIHGLQQTVAGTGHFVVELKFYSDSKYQHEFSGFPPSYMIGDKVYVDINLAAVHFQRRMPSYLD